MKKFNLSLVAVLAMSTFAIAGGDIAPMEPVIETPVMAEPVASVGNFYVGLGYSYMNMNVEIGTYEADASANSVLLLAGYNFNQYIGIEGRYSMNVGDITVSETGAPDTDYSDDFSNFGIYLKPMYPVSNEFNVYALLGYGEVTVDDGAISDSEGWVPMGSRCKLRNNWKC